MDFMAEALREAYEGIEQGHGGPFGSVVVKDGEIVGRGHNRVLYKQDATCHGEMEAIRDACRRLGTHNLSGCELYTTAEPCPMCLGAVLWANIQVVYFGCDRVDAADIGFRDDVFYQYMDGSRDLLKLTQVQHGECRRLFEVYHKKEDRIPY